MSYLGPPISLLPATPVLPIRTWHRQPKHTTRTADHNEPSPTLALHITAPLNSSVQAALSIIKSLIDLLMGLFCPPPSQRFVVFFFARAMRAASAAHGAKLLQFQVCQEPLRVMPSLGLVGRPMRRVMGRPMGRPMGRLVGTRRPHGTSHPVKAFPWAVL